MVGITVGVLREKVELLTSVRAKYLCHRDGWHILACKSERRDSNRNKNKNKAL